nr:unnamed protein product [Sorex araneus]
MSDEEIKTKTLASAAACLEGKSPGEKAAIIHQHLGRREMTDMIIETMKSNSDELKATETTSTAQRSKDQSKECMSTAPDSPSKQLPDQISFFSGNPSVEIVHGIMHLYKTNKMTSLKEDVRRSAMLCILTVPATMTSHDLMKFVAPFNEVIEQMKIIRDSTPNQYMVLIKFSAQNLWICLICGHIGCGRYVSRHAYKHFEETQHTYAMQLTNHRVWDYAGDNYVHRLVASKTDGKIVQYECEGDTCQEEKIDALQLEYSYLLTSQLESQRIYWENKIVRIEKDTAEEINNMKTKFKETIEKCDNLEHRLNDLLKEKQSMERKCTQLNTKVAKLTTELKEEQEMNKCLRANQVLLQNQLKEEERVLKETCDQKDLQITEIQEQLRDVMFYLEAQQKINHLPAETRQEIQEGQINIAMASAPSAPASGSSGKLPSRKGRSKRGK